MCSDDMQAEVKPSRTLCTTFCGLLKHLRVQCLYVILINHCALKEHRFVLMVLWQYL